MYKYTYIQAAGDKRITKRHKVRLLTIAGGKGRTGAERAAIRNTPAAGRSTTPTTPTTGTRAHLHALRISARIWAHTPTRKGWRCVQAGGLPSCSSCLSRSSCWLDICRLFSTERRGRYSLSARSATPENTPKNKASGRTVRRALKKPPTEGGWRLLKLFSVVIVEFLVFFAE